MNATDLDQTYRTLAKAIDQFTANPTTSENTAQLNAHSKPVLFLTMLSLKLISQLPDAASAETIIRQVVIDAQKPSSHELLTQQNKAN
jgi:hypothetical protein